MQLSTSCCAESVQLVYQPVATVSDRSNGAQRLKIFRDLQNTYPFSANNGMLLHFQLTCCDVKGYDLLPTYQYSSSVQVASSSAIEQSRVSSESNPSVAFLPDRRVLLPALVAPTLDCCIGLD